jgi:hypothetical protein
MGRRPKLGIMIYMQKLSSLSKYFLVILVLFAILFSRFYQLGSTPPGLHIDEVGFAADAKAIAETGRDTWNKPWPLVFEAFGEWKAPGLVYSMAFWSKVLGRMDNLVTHLPSAVAGVVSLLMLYLTLKELWGKRSKWGLLFAVFVLAFSPWHFDMSRIFYEAFSAMAFFAVGIWLITRATLTRAKDSRLWILAAVMLGLAGYWYASIRYIAILTIIIATLVQSWPLISKLKKSLLLILALLFIGLGWIGDLTSSKGLNRLEYYNNKSAEGATLEIDEKRQYCYLSFMRNADKSQFCYGLWNKPVEKLTNIGKTYYRYLGSDYLFLQAESEYGFDASYGAFLYPILPLFLVGLFSIGYACKRFLESLVRNKLNKLNPQDSLYFFYAVTILISLIPAALANNINMRMALIALYIISLIIGIGIKGLFTWAGKYLKRYAIPLLFGYLLIILFFVAQSLSHYFLVFTHSNDLMWTSDARDVFGYVKSVSSDYDYIIDTELHGPLAPYFYGDLTTSEVQSGIRNAPDDFGFSHLVQAGKYELRHANIKDLACEKYRTQDARKILTISTPINDLASIRKFAGKSWSQALLLHEVHDLDDVVTHELENNPSFRNSCSPE